MHLGASKHRTLGSCIWSQDIGIPRNLGQTRTANHCTGPEKSTSSTEQLQILQYIYACFRNKYFHVCLSLFKTKLNNNYNQNYSENGYFSFWPPLLGLIQCYTIGYINCIAKLEEPNEDSIFSFLSTSLADAMSIYIYQIILWLLLLPDLSKAWLELFVKQNKHVRSLVITISSSVFQIFQRCYLF